MSILSHKQANFSKTRERTVCRSVYRVSAANTRKAPSTHCRKTVFRVRPVLRTQSLHQNYRVNVLPVCKANTRAALRVSANSAITRRTLARAVLGGTIASATLGTLGLMVLCRAPCVQLANTKKTTTLEFAHPVR